MPYNYSPLRYPGGKTKLYNYVKELLIANNLIGETYIEPFAGGSGLALKLLLNNDVKKIVLNDLDPAIYAFWFCVLNYPDQLCEFIANTEISLNEWDRQKQIYNNQNQHTTFELGAATLFLNRTNMSGIIKGGAIGGRNQNGNYRIDARFKREDLINKIITISNHSNQKDLYNLDAKELLKQNTLKHYYKVFINLDPPYVVKGSQLYKNSFTENDHEQLQQAIKKCKRKWMVTYDVCPLVKKLYNEFRGNEIVLNYYAKTVRKSKELVYFSNNLVLPEKFL